MKISDQINKTKGKRGGKGGNNSTTWSSSSTSENKKSARIQASKNINSSNSTNNAPRSREEAIRMRRERYVPTTGTNQQNSVNNYNNSSFDNLNRQKYNNQNNTKKRKNDGSGFGATAVLIAIIWSLLGKKKKSKIKDWFYKTFNDKFNLDDLINKKDK